MARPKKAKPTTDEISAEVPMSEVAAPTPANALATIPPEVQAELSLIERLASNPRADVKKLEALLDMRERTRAGEAHRRFNEAMRDCQAEIMPVARDAENKHTNSKFAKLESIDREIRPIYTKHGFSLSFNSKSLDDGRVRILCTVGHTAGHFEPYELDGHLDTAGAKGNANKTNLQGLGSTVSYLRRYLTCMIFNVVLTDEDNDGGQAGKRQGSDRFDDKMRAQNQGKAVDAQFTEVQPPEQGEAWPVIFNDGVGNKKFKSVTSAAKYLKASLENVTDKKQRLDILLDNTAILQGLEKAGEAELITALHATANNGAANG